MLIYESVFIRAVTFVVAVYILCKSMYDKKATKRERWTSYVYCKGISRANDD